MMTKALIRFGLAAGMFGLVLPAFSAQKTELNEPLFAKIILSRDKTKVLPIILDKPQKGHKNYNILITDKSCNGKLRKPYKPGAKTDYKYHILTSVNFTPIDLPPLYCAEAKNSTKVAVSMYCNEDRIDNRFRDKENKVKIDENMVIDRLLADIHIELGHESGQWTYDLRRIFTTSSNPKTAPICDITDPPKLMLELGYEKGRSKKVGIVSRLAYYGSYAEPKSIITDTTIRSTASRGYNRFSCKHVGQDLEAVITVKNAKGEVIQTHKKPLSSLWSTVELTGKGKRKAHKNSRKKNFRKHEELTSDDYETKYNCMVFKPEGGGTVEVAVDTGPMFGVIKASKEL
jgi:hypothetical protein